jgi:hypothetical protein
MISESVFHQLDSAMTHFRLESGENRRFGLKESLERDCSAVWKTSTPRISAAVSLE